MKDFYCVKCREKRDGKDVEKITLKNGKPARKATCEVCGTKMFHIGSKMEMEKDNSEINKDQATMDRLKESIKNILDTLHKGKISSQEAQVLILSQICSVLIYITAIQQRIETALTFQSNILSIVSKGFADKLNEVIYEIQRVVPAIGSIAAHASMIELATKSIQHDMMGEDGIKELLRDIRSRIR